MEMKKALIPVGAIALVATGAGIAGSASITNAAEDEGQRQRPQISEEEREERRAMHEQIKADVDHEKLDIENGVRLLFTSDNSELLDTIEERATEKHRRITERHEDHDVVQTISREGSVLTIEITSDNPETVERIQDHDERRKHHREHHGEEHEEHEDDEERAEHRMERHGQKGGGEA